MLRFEDILDRPQHIARQLHEFLGVEFQPQDVEGLGVINPSEKRGETMDDDMRRDLQARYAGPNRRLAALLGPDFEMW
jgi:hypothetical protein